MNTENHIREGNILHRLMSSHFERAMRAGNGYVAGGAVRALFSSDHISDFDIFFREQAGFDACVKALSNGENSPTFTTTDTAWTHQADDKMRYQLICAEFGEPDEVIHKFDFTCCMGAWLGGSDFVLDPLFLKHCAQRRLVFNAKAGYPICSLWRAVKFVKRGWRLPGTEAIKLALAINHLKLSDRKELKRQLMGIDTLFLKELTDALAQNGEVKYDYMEAIEMVAAFVDREED